MKTYFKNICDLHCAQKESVFGPLDSTLCTQNGILKFNVAVRAMSTHISCFRSYNWRLFQTLCCVVFVLVPAPKLQK